MSDQNNDGFQVVTNKRKSKTNNNNNNNQPQDNRKRASNRRLISVLLERYEQMTTRRWGTDITTRPDVNMNDLLLDCFKYDLNVILGSTFEYSQLDRLQTEEGNKEFGE